MRWLKHLILVMVGMAIATGSAVSITDSKHLPPAAAPPAAVPAQPESTLAPVLERISEQIEDERAVLASTAESLNASSAKVTFLLIGCFVLAILLVCILVAQVIILYRSMEVVRADTVTRNRPRLVVRHVDLEIFTPGRLAKVHWMVENIGNSAATVVEARATLLVMRRGKLPAVPQYDERNHAGGGLAIEAGRMVPFVQFSHEDIAAGDHDAVFRSGEGLVFFFGCMLYIDDVAARRRIGFCRQYDPASGRFIVVDDMNYEYAD